jgi:molybdate transport system substrate-binding protein
MRRRPAPALLETRTGFPHPSPVAAPDAATSAGAGRRRACAPIYFAEDIVRLLLILLLAVPSFAAEVRVFAAVSLTEALNDIARDYEKKTGVDIVFNFGASSMLARQIEQGAPADLFLSADEARVDALGRLVVRRASVLSNSLVIVVPRNSRIASPNDLAKAKRIALAEPSSVPAGIYAKAWLQKAGLWKRVAPNVIPTDNVRAALAAVDSANVDAAIVYKTDARIARRSRVAFEVPKGQAPAISSPFALLRNDKEAARFFAHLRSKSALDVFRRHGFLVK